jgi:hypothetical protein
MVTTPRSRSSISRAIAILLLGCLSFAFAQVRVNGVVGACAQVAPADLVAEARAGLAWFPVEVGRGSLGADGAFALQFAEDPYLPIEVTLPVARLFDDERCEAVSISDPDARLVVVRHLRIVPRGAACEYCETLGTLYAASQAQDRLSTTGDLEVQWIYSDREVEVGGRCHHGWGDESYELSLAAGWNTVVIETVTVHPSIGYCDCHDVVVSVAPFPTAAVAWHFVPAR